MAGIFEKAAPDRIELAEAGAHRNHWPASRKITSAAIAEPPAVCLDVNILRHGELAARMRDEVAVMRHIGRDRTRIDEAPAAGRYGRAHPAVGRRHRHAETADLLVAADDRV